MTNPWGLPEPACDCAECRSYCEHAPCWPTPEEAHAIMDAGFGPRLMLQWTNATDEYPDAELLCGAVVGHEGKRAPTWPRGRCALLTDDGKCPLHALGLKPVEGRIAHHATDVTVHARIAHLWATDAGRDAVARWKRDHAQRDEGDDLDDGVPEPSPFDCLQGMLDDMRASLGGEQRAVFMGPPERHTAPCPFTFGEPACGATGAPCDKTLATCKDPPRFGGHPEFP